MSRVRIGASCSRGHFTYFGDLWEPVKDKDVDKLAERSAVPVACEECNRDLGLPHVEGRQRESNQLARVGGKNVSEGLKRGSKPKPKEGPLTPAEWKRRVFERQRVRPGGPALCAVTGEPLDFTRDDCHHVLEKRLLRARGLHHLVWDERNAMFIKARVHTAHTSGLIRIPHDCVPASAFAFAREVGEWAVQRIETDHPEQVAA
jgi:hypothetical protein